jgi:CHAT domain-containing protein/tetratricopeptide (TPR) repeat protein
MIMRSILRFAARRETKTAAIAVAVVNLLASRLDVALRTLEDAVDTDPTSALALTDLAAVYIEKGQRTYDPYYFDQALATSEAAIRLDGAMPEALFNRSLALEHLYLDTAARASWQAYLRLDRNSPWAREARDHSSWHAPEPSLEWKRAKDELDRALDPQRSPSISRMVAAFPQACREYAEQDLLPAWAREQAIGHPEEALRALRLAAGIGEALAATNGDRLTVEAAQAVQVALRGDPQRRDALAAGHRDFRTGLDRLRQTDHEAAFAAFERARKELARGGSPMAEWARLYLAVCDYQRSRFGDAGREIGELLAHSSTGHASLGARARWLQGLIHMVGRQPLEARDPYVDALVTFRRLRETENAAVLEHLLAEDLEYLGERHEAWRHRLVALAQRWKIRDPQRISSILDEAAEAAVRQREWPLASYFYDAMLEHDRQWGNPYVLVYTHLRRSRVRVALGQPGLAMADQEAAERHMAEIRDASFRRRLEAEAALARAQVHASRGEHEQAVADLGRLLDYYQTTGFTYDLTEAYTLRSRCWRALRHFSEAEADLRAGIKASESQVGTPGSESLVLSHLDELRELLDEMVEFQLTLSRPDTAFDFAERSRARVLLDYLASLRWRRGDRGEAAPPGVERLAAVTQEPLISADLHRQLPAPMVLVEYALLERRCVAFVIAAGTLKAVTLPGTPRVIEQVAARLVSALRKDAEGGDAAVEARTLFDLVLRPLLSVMPAGTELVIVPDKGLWSVPFAALQDKENGRYLIEDHVLTLAPSATLFLDCLRRAQRLGVRGPARDVLLVSNPAIPPAQFPDLRSLPGAEAEAREIAKLYGRAELLTREPATKQRFAELAPGFSIVQVDAHAIVDRENPMLSNLRFAPLGPDTGALYSHEIYRLTFQHTRLLVLGACSTAGGRISVGEGVSSLARPFLGAGIPAVIASLSPVEDSAAARLLVELHRHLTAGASAAGALRSAQLASLRSMDRQFRSPAAWGWFELLGASTLPGTERRLP